ncbi:MAG: thioredoxin family protein [Rhodospirillaceae bacterium]|nr:thioredoxin family protein [Rhodospirillaceae bacterium]|tara:strand:- start:541 stop:1086 length:546 start_codon:yes stop_codon:yes gene_type:complete
MPLNTPICDFGWQAPNFTLHDTNNQLHQLDSLVGLNGLLIAFICNHCPYVKAIIDRLVSDATALQQHGINTVAIMPNDYHSYPEDSPENMVAFITRHHIPFPYLIDETQQVAKVYGAVCTPDFFGLNAEGKLHYRGRLDDIKIGTSNKRQPELLEAMIKVAETGRGPEHQAPSMGCSIKWR